MFLYNVPSIIKYFDINNPVNNMILLSTWKLMTTCKSE